MQIVSNTLRVVITLHGMESAKWILVDQTYLHSQVHTAYPPKHAIKQAA